jgi:hypothetical protein
MLGRGDCFGPVPGADGQNISVPCTCPPDRVVYIDVRPPLPTSSFAVSDAGYRRWYRTCSRAQL